MYGTPPPPPYGGNPYYPTGPYYPYPPPHYYPPPQRKKSNGCVKSCCRCICCCCCFLLLLVFIQLLSVFYFYYVYDPKVPSYGVERVHVRSFDIKSDSSLTTHLQVVIRAENPNKNIGFIYGSNSWVTVDYSNVVLSAGKLPEFRQGHDNTTLLEVDLNGNTTLGHELQQQYVDDQKSRRIPLMVKMRVPVHIVLGDIPLREFRVFVNCSMVVEGLKPNKSAKIRSKDTMFSIDI